MRHRAAFALALLASCAGSAAQQEDDAPAYDYGGVRNPFPVAKTEPVVPPAGTAAAPDPPPAPKADPCIRLCAAYTTADAACDRLALKCQEMFQAQGHMNGDTCREKERVCGRVADTHANLGTCRCS